MILFLSRVWRFLGHFSRSISMLHFRCEQCEVEFDSEPDGTGYEQAPCPKCGSLSMTVEYLKSEKRAFQFSLRTFLIVLFIIAVLIACCLPIWHRHGDIGGFMHGHPIWEWGHVH